VALVKPQVGVYVGSEIWMFGVTARSNIPCEAAGLVVPARTLATLCPIRTRNDSSEPIAVAPIERMWQ